MAERMSEQQLMFQEKTNSGTAWTRNESFDKDGYVVVKDLWDAEELYHPVPDVKGQMNYWDKNPDHINHVEVENQVEGSLARYYHPDRHDGSYSGLRPSRYTGWSALCLYR